MEDRYAETVRLPVSPRQDEIQGRPHGGSAVAPITPDIGSLGCDFDEIHGTRAVDILQFRDHTTHLSNTPRHEDLVDTIHRLEAENKALRGAQDEDIKEAEESTQLIEALQQCLHVERTHQTRKKTIGDTPAPRARGTFSPDPNPYVHPPRPSVGGVTFGKDKMHEWTLSPTTMDSEISSMEASFVQA